MIRKLLLPAALLFVVADGIGGASAFGQGSPVPLGSEMVPIPAGSHLPFFAGGDGERPPVAVAAFRMDRYPVTQGEFLRFVKQNPEWRKSRVKSLFADPHYLEDWAGDLSLGRQVAAQGPVTRVSWFAAKAYCEAQGKTLPTADQWEYALNDADRNPAEVIEKTLAWYSQPNERRLPSVRKATRNGFGVSGLVGLVWEWTLDFNGVMMGEEGRDASAQNRGNENNRLFCGSGSIGARDAADYPAFMRYSFRNSLKAKYTTPNLGFRCVIPQEKT